MPEPPPDDGVLPTTCSARGCRAQAGWVLVWNNPRVHAPQRRKTWVSCDEHRERLAQFLGVRNFLIEVVELGAWEAGRAEGETGPTGAG